MSENLCQTKAGLLKTADTMKKENGCNRWSCNSLEEPFGRNMLSQMVTKGASQGTGQNRIKSAPVVSLLKGQNIHESFVSAVNASNSDVSSYPEKLLPINKRRSLYYISQEDANGLVTDEVEATTGVQFDAKRYGYARNCFRSEHSAIKIRRLQSIYKETKPITIDLQDLS